MDSHPQVLVAQIGARIGYGAPLLLHRAGMLAHLYVDTYVGRGSPWHMLAKLVPFIPEAWKLGAIKHLLVRQTAGLPPEVITAFNLFGLSYARALRRARDFTETEQATLGFGNRFCELVLRNKLRDGDAIYAFKNAALPLFQAAEQMGLYRILEESGAPTLIYHQLLAEEHRLWPGWESPYPGQEVFQPRIDMDRQEWSLADSILCGSTFVAQGLESLGVPPEKIKLVPYGMELSRFASISPPWDGHRPLRVLFLGRVSLGKGVQYLYEALKSLDTPAITARMVGPISLREPYRRLLAEHSELTGMVPHYEVHQHCHWADLLAFPTICDSFGMVQVEALAAGRPVIATPNAGSVVRDGVDGFIVPIRDSLALAQKIDLLARDPNLLTRMSQNARERVQEFSLERYGERLVAAILEE